jgi:uncharacterized membrane protein YeaQ/YmgE (transglycosylase-associated protein family)
MSNDKIKKFILITTPLIGLLAGYVADASNPSGNNLGAFIGFIYGIGALLLIIIIGSSFEYFNRNKIMGRKSILGYLLTWIVWVVFMINLALQLSGFILT